MLMTKTLKELFDKYREYILFVLAGGVNTVLDFGVFSLLLAVRPEWGEVPAQALGYTCGLVCGYFLNKYVTFRSNAKGATQAVKFVLCNMFTLAVSMGLIHVFVSVLGAQEHLAKLFLVSPVTMVINFVLYKFVVFGKNSHMTT